MAANISISQNNQRADFDRMVRAVASASGLSPEQVVENYTISKQTLLMVAPLSTGSQLYQFNPVQATGNPLPNGLAQIQMNKNDWFYISGLGLQFGKADFSSSSGSFSNVGNFPRFSFPDPNYFTGAPAGQKTEVECLNTVVNGVLNLTVMSNPVIINLVCRNLVFNPQSTYTSSPLAYPQIGPSQSERGYNDLTPNVVLDGNADNVFTVTLANGAYTDIDGATWPGTNAATTRNLLYLCADGWIVKNQADGGRQCAQKV